MIVLHAAWLQGEVLFWGERVGPTPPRKAASRSAKIPALSPAAPLRITRWPHVVRPDDLRPALAGELLAHGVTFEHPGKASLALADLPVMDGHVLHSGQLKLGPDTIADFEPSEPVTFKSWRLDVLKFPLMEALDALLALGTNEKTNPDLTYAGDFKFLCQTASFALHLVARRQIVPGIQCHNGITRARWEPLLVADDLARAESMAEAMPAVLHGLRASRPRASEEDAGTPTARQQFDALLAGWVDFLVRRAEHVRFEAARRPGEYRYVTDYASYGYSLHDQWLRALQAQDGRLKWDEPATRLLANQLKDWTKPARASSGSPWRLCFRLEEPAEPANLVAEVDADGTVEAGEDLPGSEDAGSSSGPVWRLRVLWQARRDPSLLLPGSRVWRGDYNPALVPPLTSADRQAMLQALAKAADASREFNANFGAGVPDEILLDATAAYHFLMTTAPQLQRDGFGVFLPAWWTARAAEPALTARAVIKSPLFQGNGLGMNELLRFDWELALGGDTITREELDELARLKEPLVHFRGQWLELSGDQIEKAQKFWKQRASPRASLRDVVHMALGATTPEAGSLPIEGVSADGWVGDMLLQLQGAAPLEDVPAPAGFAGQLRPYQERGTAWLNFMTRFGLGACLADDMGLGKTPTTLSFLQSRRENGEGRPVLLVCPTSVIANWQKEAARFTPELPVLVHHGVRRSKGEEFLASVAGQALVISSYSLMARDVEMLSQVPWAGVVLDEAQNIKNAETRQSRAVCSLPADFRLALTGTPVENNVGDLWSIMEFLNGGFLGNRAEFNRMFFQPIQNGSDPQAAVRLQRLTTPFVLRRLKTDRSIITDLPEKLEMKVFCTLTKEQGSLYAAVVKESTRALEMAAGIQRRGIVLSTLMKLKQVCNHPAQFLSDQSAIAGRSGKLARLTEMLEEMLSTGERALIFSQFQEMGDLLQRHLREALGREVLFLHGGTPKKARDEMVENFQMEGDSAPPIFVLSLKAGGVGLNLTKANHVFHFDRWWNPAVENQATDRAFRIGQTKNVQVHKFLCAGTLEDKIDEMIDAKQKMAQQVVGSGENWLTELSTAELKDLFALRREAFGE